MNRNVFLGLLAFLLFSCNSDSQEEILNDNSNVVMTGYKITSQSSYSDVNGNNSHQRIVFGNLVDNKLYSQTAETIHNGISQGIHTEQNYFYTDNLLSTREISGDKKDFFYDSSRNLIGINWTKLDVNSGDYVLMGNYRFSYHPANIVFAEKVTLPYNDSAAQIISRSIVQFDINNNIIKAGFDSNLDGVMDAINNFTYVNDNLVSVQKADGNIISFDYSNVINNFMILNYNSYGKKVFRLLNYELYSFVFADDFKDSKSLSSQEFGDATYEVLSNGYYKKKITNQNFPENNAQNTTTTEFFFQ